MVYTFKQKYQQALNFIVLWRPSFIFLQLKFSKVYLAVKNLIMRKLSS